MFERVLYASHTSQDTVMQSQQSKVRGYRIRASKEEMLSEVEVGRSEFS